MANDGQAGLESIIVENGDGHVEPLKDNVDAQKTAVDDGVSETGDAAMNVLDETYGNEIAMFKKAIKPLPGSTVSFKNGKFVVITPGVRDGLSYLDVYSGTAPYTKIYMSSMRVPKVGYANKNE